MRNIKFIYIALLTLLSLLWWLADPLLANGYSIFALRTVLINYTGVLAIGVMSVGMILAMRLTWLEPWLNGIDKGYRLHKWLGITGLVLAVAHWLWAQGIKWAIGWGWLTRPQRPPRVEETDAVLRFLQQQRGLAESVGEWAFYAAVVLIVLALVKRFPYRHFFKTHRLLAAVYLLLVLHAVVLTPFAYWGEPVGAVLALLMGAGSVSAVLSLTRRIGTDHRALAEIEALTRFTDNRVLKVDVRFRGRWPGHEAGQFVFVTFDAEEGPHPFTISSAWHNDGRMSLMIKALGDYTTRLPELLHVGDPLTIEGPYGQFSFAGERPHQIWVGGGIGITPFVARLQALASAPDGKAVDLFYSTAEPDERFIAKLKRDAAAAGVKLRLWLTARDGRLDVEAICKAVPDWTRADVWFCGPAAFGEALRQGFTARGLPGEAFHRELFEMR